MSGHHLSRTNLWIFGLPLAILVLLPVVCWFVVYGTQTPSGIASDAMFVLFYARSDLGMIPGFVFQQPLFDPTEIGYSPHGLPPWDTYRRFLGRDFARHFSFAALLPTLRASLSIKIIN